MPHSANKKQENIMASDPLSDLSMKPSRDELASRQGQKTNTKKSYRTEVGTVKPTPHRNGPILIVLLLIVVGAGAGGWFMWQEMGSLSKELHQSKQLLSESQSSLGDLKQNIALQSDSMDQTGSEIQQQIKLHMSEIRKLWDVANKTNKPAIAENSKALSKLESNLAGQKKQLSNVVSSSDAMAKSVTSMQAQLQQGELQTSVLNSQLSELEAQLKALVEQNKSLKTSIDAQEVDINRLKVTSGKSLEAKLVEINQRLDSIDAHRRQVNARLEQQQRSIDQLYKKP
ncbi:MAG: hypothetical protein MI976_13825 [Pseudomonadales bacterium]|nr:hypothetical protein [Pseudomonadales bacterium]